MKIALVSVVELPITKNVAGGTEAWTHSFAEEMVSRGHDVTLYANDSSQTSAKLIPVCRQEDVLSSDGQVNKYKNYALCVDQMIKVVADQDRYDLIHVSTSNPFFYFPFANLCRKPLIFTLHSKLTEPQDMETIYRKYPKINYCFVSEFLKGALAGPSGSRAIMNGLPISDFPYSQSKKDYFFWIGRLTPEKGAEAAIEAAENLEANLVIGGRISDQNYFDQKIKPRLSERISYVGELGFEEKTNFYKDARATLMTSSLEEACPLVNIESMACGTPVIAFDTGGNREMVVSGENGYLTPKGDIGQLEDAMKKIGEIEPQDCHDYAVNHFSVGVMAEKYEKAYEEAINGL